MKMAENDYPDDFYQHYEILIICTDALMHKLDCIALLA